MFLLDDLLFAPIKGLAAVCQKVHEAAQEDLEAQEKAVLADLAELHHLLDVGQISDDDFNIRETGVLDRLDACRISPRPGLPAADEQSAAGRRPCSMNLALAAEMSPAAETDDTVLELLDRVLNTGVVLARRRDHHRGRYRVDLPPLAVVAQLGGDGPAGGMARRGPHWDRRPPVTPASERCGSEGDRSLVTSDATTFFTSPRGLSPARSRRPARRRSASIPTTSATAWSAWC